MDYTGYPKQKAHCCICEPNRCFEHTVVRCYCEEHLALKFRIWETLPVDAKNPRYPINKGVSKCLK